MARSLSAEASPPMRHATLTFAASTPRTSFVVGVVIGASSLKVGLGRLSFGFMLPKYFLMMAIISSGSKSPERQMAILLGTYQVS